MKQQIDSKILVLSNIEANIAKATENLATSTKKVEDFLKEYGTDDALSDVGFCMKRTNYIEKIRSHVQIYVKQKLNTEIQRLDDVARQTAKLETDDVDDSIALNEVKEKVAHLKAECKKLYELINAELANLAALYQKFSKDAAKCEALKSNQTEINIATKVLNITGILIVLVGLAFLCHLIFPDFWQRVAPIVLLAAAGTALTVAGIFGRLKVLRISGLISTGLATILFLVTHGIGEFFEYIGRTTEYAFGGAFLRSNAERVTSFQFSTAFTWTYLAVTAALFIIVGAFIYNKTKAGTGLRLLKGLAALNLWLYLMHLVNQLQVAIFRMINEDGYRLIFSAGENGPVLIGHNSTGWIFIATAISLAITVAMALGLTKIKPIASKGFYGVSVALSIIALTEILGFVTFTSRHSNVFASVAIYIIVAGASLVAFYNLFARPSFKEVRVYKRAMLICFASFLILYLTIAATVQYSLSFTSYYITGGYVAIAIALIVFGLLKNYAAIRRFALGLSFFAVFKLLFIDFHTLDDVPRVVASISTGLALVGISFIYQAFAKKLKDVNYATIEMEEISSESSAEK